MTAAAAAAAAGMSCSYDVQYLGSSMLTKPATTTGLGVLQQPLIDLYVGYFQPKSPNPRPLPSRRITLTDRGMIISALNGDVSDDQDAFYAMPSIIFWEAVRFVAVRISDRKYRGAFEPVGEGHVTKENLYTEMDKRHVHLASQVKHHPVLLVCVLRRTTGIKALDLHAFVCSSSRLGVSIAETLSIAQESYNNQQSNASDAFSYDPFDKGNVRQMNGLQIIHTVSPAAGSRLMMADVDVKRRPGTVSASSLLSSSAPLRSDLQPSTQSRDDLQLRPYNVGPTSVSERQEPAMFAASCMDVSTSGGGGDYFLTQGDLIGVQYTAAASQRVPQMQSDPPNRHQMAKPVGRSQTFYGQRQDKSSPFSALSHVPSTWLDDGEPTTSGAGPVPSRMAANVSRSQTFRTQLPSPPQQQQLPAGDGNVTRPNDPWLLPANVQSVSGFQLQQQQQPLYDIPRQPWEDRRPLKQQQQQPVNAAAAPRNAPAQSAAAAVDAGRYFDFHFGIEPSGNGSAAVAAASSASTAGQTASEGAAPNGRPVALVQPRKVQGIRVLPGDIGQLIRAPTISPPQKAAVSSVPSASATSAAAASTTAKSEVKSRLSESHSNPEPLPSSKQEQSKKSFSREAEVTKREERRPVGTLREHLKNCASNKQQQQPAVSNEMAARMRDFNFNLKTPSSSDPPQQHQSTASSSLSPSSASGRGELQLQQLFKAPNSRQPSPQPPASAAVAAAAAERSKKDDEIASAVGDIRLDYQNPTNTLSAHGTNFEKCLGYFP
jgi:hypothetical protein